MTYCNCPTFL